MLSLQFEVDLNFQNKSYNFVLSPECSLLCARIGAKVVFRSKLIDRLHYYHNLNFDRVPALLKTVMNLLRRTRMRVWNSQMIVMMIMERGGPRASAKPLERLESITTEPELFPLEDSEYRAYSLAVMMNPLQKTVNKTKVTKIRAMVVRSAKQELQIAEEGRRHRDHLVSQKEIGMPLLGKPALVRLVERFQGSRMQKSRTVRIQRTSEKRSVSRFGPFRCRYAITLSVIGDDRLGCRCYGR